MHGEQFMQRQKLKGYIFEIVLLKLLKENGFIEVTERGEKIKEEREYFLEVRGRGAWHQIDCLCDYSIILPFLYPIRMIGEVKYYSNAVSKDKIREFIGVVKDIQENYFVADNYSVSFNRVSELGVFFSVSGFEVQAERLAFAHNIKTISYKNNHIINKIRQYIDELERNYLYARECISAGNYNEFRNQFIQLLNGYRTNNILYFRNRFDVSDGIEYIIDELQSLLENIRTNFIASTSGGVFLHFLGFDTFPDELFENTDEQTCEVYYTLDNGKSYWLTFSEDYSRRKFYFTPPETLEEAAFYGGQIVLDEKERIFKIMQISKIINNIKRNLTIRLNTTWLDNVRRQH